MTDVEHAPDAVAQSAQFLADRGVWHVISQNPPVRSCAEAARYRRRLGSVGIPLCDELKSMLCAYRGPDGRDHVGLLHCRGHQQLDLGKVGALVGAQVELVGSHVLKTAFGRERGTVTPFLPLRGTSVRQLVDDTVLQDFYPPHTMMTNLGDLGRAVEFRAPELFDALDDVVVADIVKDGDKQVPRQVLGLVVGGVPEAGALLMAKINAKVREDSRVKFRGTSGLPPMVFRSVPALGLSMTALKLDAQVQGALVSAVEGVCRSGATTVTVVSPWTDHFSGAVEKVCSAHSARFVSPLVEVARLVRTSGIHAADLLGLDGLTGRTGQDDLQDDRHALFDGIDVRRPTAWQLTALDQLTHAVRAELVSGATITRLRDLVRSCRTGTAVVTVPELSILLASQTSRRRSTTALVDALDAVARTMADMYVEERVAAGAA